MYLIHHAFEASVVFQATALCDILYKRLGNTLTYLLTYLLTCTGLQVTQVESCTGETVTLACYTAKSIGVDWRYKDNSSTHYVVASSYVQKDFQDRFRLNRTAKHQHSLMISDIRLEDQGVYICIEDAGLGVRREYQLTVHGQIFGVFLYDVSVILILQGRPKAGSLRTRTPIPIHIT